MSREEVFNLIDEKKAEIDKPFVCDARVSHCNKWLSEHKYLTSQDFSKIDIFELLKYLAPILLDITDIETTNSICELFYRFFSERNSKEILSFYNIVSDILYSGEIDNVICMLNMGECDEADEIAARITGLTPEFVNLLRVNGDYSDEGDIGSDFATLLHVLKNHNEAFFDMLYVISAHKAMVEGYNFIDDRAMKKFSNHSQKIKRRVAEKYKKKYFKYDDALSIVNRIGSFVVEKEQEQKKAERNKKSQLDRLDELKKMLCIQLQQDEITNVRNLVNGIDDSELVMAVLGLVREHNKIYYDKLKVEYDKLSNNTEANYKAVLHDFGIKSKNYDIRKIMHLKLEEINYILEILIRRFSFDEEKALHVLENSDLEKVELISKYISNGYISIDYVSNNINLYDLDSSDIDTMVNNINLLNLFNVNPYIFKCSMEVLFGDSVVINDNLQLLKNYNLLKYFKTANNFMFLLNNNLSSIIDKYLELGYESLLKENMNILNFNNIKRLDVIHMLNIPIDSVDELNDVLSSKKFFMSDNEIDFYLFNFVDYKDKVKFDMKLDNLEQFKCGNRCYNFNGVLVSIQKVKRLLQSGKDLYDSIFDGMYVNEDEYNRILNCLYENCILI